MAHLQYMPGDPRLVDQLVYELKTKGIFDQFRKECIADVDTRPAYQNLRQRVESSVAAFLSRQSWKPDLNKNQLREKLRKHILDGNYLEQGVERIVDQVVNPKVASVFIPQVEDLVYNYLGITRKKTTVETVEIPADLLPTDLEAVSPGSVKSNDDKNELSMDIDSNTAEKMDTDKENQQEETKEMNGDKKDDQNSITEILSSNESDVSMDKSAIPLPSDEIKLENIPEPENSPPKAGEVELEKISLPKEQVPSTDIPLPEEAAPVTKETHFKPLLLHSEDSNSSSGSSLIRNMSPLTPIRNYNNENSSDAQQAFDNDSKSDSNSKNDGKTEQSCFRFTIEGKDEISDAKPEKEQKDLAYQLNQVNINAFNTPLYDDSSNSNNLRIDYESDTNSKATEKTETEQEDKKEKKDDKKNHKSSHRSRDSHRHSSKDKRSDSKHSNSRDGSRNDKKPSTSKDDNKKSSKDSRDSKDRSDKKENRDSSKHKSSKSSSHKDSKSHRSSSSNQRHSKNSDERKSSSHRDKEKESKDRSKDTSKDRSKDTKSSSRSDKDRKSSSKKSDDKDKKKDKKDTDDHYSSSGRGNHGRRSTDRDSNDGSSSSKGSQSQNNPKNTENKKGSKSSSSKSDNTSNTSGDNSSPSDKDQKVNDSKLSQFKPAIRVDNHLETPITNPPRLPFVPDITLKKPKFAANLAEAKKMMKMRKFLDDEQKRMNQEAALLLEFQANVRPSLSQVYSSIPGPELEFACGNILNQEQIEPDPMNLNNSDEKVTLQTDPVVTQDNSDESFSDQKYQIQLDNPSAQQIYDIILGNPEEPQQDIKNETYDENKPFSKLVEEISEYSKASDKAKLDKVSDQIDEPKTTEAETNTKYNDVMTGITSESDSQYKIDEEDKMEIIEGETVDEIESPPFEDITDDFSKNEIKAELNTMMEKKLHKSIGKQPTNIILTEKPKQEIINVSHSHIVIEKRIEAETDTENEHPSEVIKIEETKNCETISSKFKKALSAEVDIIDEDSVIVTIIADETNIDKKENKEVIETTTNEAIIIENQEIKLKAKVLPAMKKDTETIPVDDIKEQSIDNEGVESLKNTDKDREKRNNEKKKDSPVRNNTPVNISKEANIEKDPQHINKREKIETNKHLQSEVIHYEDDIDTDDILKYFEQDEITSSKNDVDNFAKFFKPYTDISSKLYVINCDTYEENIIKEVSKKFGDYQIVNYFKNGHLKLPTSKNIVKDIPLTEEVTLPIESNAFVKTIFSPPKSECSFELSSDYDDRLDEIVNKKSRQEVMEIILGGVPDEGPKLSQNELSKKEIGNDSNLKRKADASSNASVLTPTKLRKISDCDQISSTTEETEVSSNNNKLQPVTRSKFLGRIKRVGLPRPKRCNIVNSPNSDKSVENYVQDAPINGKMKLTPRTKVQRYDTSDLYKPKLHYLSRRNNIT